MGVICVFVLSDLSVYCLIGLFAFYFSKHCTNLSKQLQQPVFGLCNLEIRIAAVIV